MTKKKKTAVLLGAVLLILAVLWGSGIIPTAMAKNTAIRYVNEHYEDRNLAYSTIEYSPQYGQYLVSFLDQNKEQYNFGVVEKYLPIAVLYDSILSSDL